MLVNFFIVSRMLLKRKHLQSVSKILKNLLKSEMQRSQEKSLSLGLREPFIHQTSHFCTQEMIKYFQTWGRETVKENSLQLSPKHDPDRLCLRTGRYFILWLLPSLLRVKTVSNNLIVCLVCQQGLN